MRKKAKIIIESNKNLGKLPQAPIFKKKIEAAEVMLSKLTEKDLRVLNSKY